MIAIVVDVFPTVSETFIVNQINSLIEAGHEVQVFAYQKGNIQQKHSSIQKHNLLSNVIYFQNKSESRSNRFFNFLNWFSKNFFSIRWSQLFNALNVAKQGKDALSLSLFNESQWFLSGKEFDIVHSHFGHIAQRIAFLKSKGFIKNSKLVSTFHGFDLVPNNAQVYNDIYRTLLKESAACTVNSEYLKNIFLSLKCDNFPVYILPAGLDTSFFKKSNPKKDEKTFELLFCGRLIELKGPDMAVDIVKELILRGHKKIKLTIIGDGPLEDVLKEKIESCHSGKNIILTGAMTQDSIKEKMDMAHLFLMPGTYDPITERAETQGLVLQEAQAMELPVVISDVGGMKYGLIPDKTGFVVKEGDIMAFADAIVPLIADKYLRESMGQKGREYVVSNFDNKVLCKRLLGIYQDVLTKNS